MSSIGFRAIVFDLDGTLIESLQDSRAALNQVLVEERCRELTLAEMRSIVGDGAVAMVRRGFGFSGQMDVPDAMIERHVKRYLEICLVDPGRYTEIYPGVLDVLVALARDGVAMGVCTNKPKATAGAVLKRIGLAELFRAVVCPEDVVRKKPHGEHVLATLAGIGARPAESIFVGDSETDIAAARHASLPSIAVSYGYSHMPVAALGADAIIEGFAQLPATLHMLASARGLV